MLKRFRPHLSICQTALSKLTGQNHHAEKLFMASCLGAIWLLMNCSGSPCKGVLMSWKKAMDFIMFSCSPHLPPVETPSPNHFRGCSHSWHGHNRPAEGEVIPSRFIFSCNSSKFNDQAQPLTYSFATWARALAHSRSSVTVASSPSLLSSIFPLFLSLTPHLP